MSKRRADQIAELFRRNELRIDRDPELRGRFLEAARAIAPKLKKGAEHAGEQRRTQKGS